VMAARSLSWVRWLKGISASITAITGVVESVAGLLRQLVQAAGWLLLLVGCGELFFHPHLSVALLAAPGRRGVGCFAGVRPAARPCSADGGPCG
jgi:hypothetical protein